MLFQLFRSDIEFLHNNFIEMVNYMKPYFQKLLDTSTQMYLTNIYYRLSIDAIIICLILYL